MTEANPPVEATPPPATSSRAKIVRGIVDYAGLVAFLAVFLWRRDLVIATWGLVVGSAFGLAVGFVMERRVAAMPLIMGGAALFFGALTLIFHDVRFLKIKPTITNLTFAVALFVGLAIRRSPLKILLGGALHLSDIGWRLLSWRYAIFFLAVAVLNLAVAHRTAEAWNSASDPIWAFLRFPGLMIITMVFTLSQIPFFMKHMLTDPGSPDTPAQTRP
jgi:intracellular septation protein